MSRYLLAVDAGSQSTKVSVVGLDGTVHASAQVALRPYDLGPGGRVVHPDDDLWTSLGQAVRTALSGVDLADIAAVGLCGVRFCRAVLGADDRLLEPVWSWMDDRIGRPHVLDQRTATLASAGGYLGIRLTGRRRDSAANLQGIWPLDQASRQWSTDPADFVGAGMPRSVLPEVVDPGDLLGEVTAAASAHTGLPIGLPVYASANDKAVEALGCGLVGPGRLLLSLGTYIAAMTVGGSGEGADDRYWVNAHAVPGRYLYESGGIRRGMWTVSWLRDLVTAAEREPQPHADVLAWLETGAQDVPPGCDGLLTVPDWLAPPDQPHRRGAFLGLHGAHGAHHLYRSILEGILLTMRGKIDAMEQALGQRSVDVVISGGGSRSPLMARIAAAVLERPVERAAVADAAGLGAAICAAVGHGLHPDFAAAAAAMVRPGERVLPTSEDVAAYTRIRAVYADLDVLTEPLLHRLAALRTPTSLIGPG